MRTPAIDPIMTISGDLKAVKDPASPKWPDFYAKYSRYLARVARKRGLPERKVDDMVADVMAELAVKLQGFEYDRSKGRFRSFLSTLIGRRMIDQMRAEQIRPGTAPQRADERFDETRVEDQQPDETLRSSADRALLELAQQVVSRAMHELRGPSHKYSEQQLQAFELNVLQELDASAVCERLGIDNPQKVYNAKTRIMEAFEEACRKAMDQLAPGDTAFRRG